MTRRQLALTLLPTSILIVLGVVLFGIAWKANQSIEDRKSKFAAVAQHARAIDAKAGIATESATSASAMAQALKASDDAEAAYVQLLQAAGALMLIIAAFQAAAIWQLRYQSEPSNPTVERDARKSGARPSP
jgi:hypothetical protein